MSETKTPWGAWFMPIVFGLIAAGLLATIVWWFI
jgi:hypothetical protein